MGIPTTTDQEATTSNDNELVGDDNDNHVQADDNVLHIIRDGRADERRRNGYPQVTRQGAQNRQI